MCGRYTLSRPGDLLTELGVETTEPLSARYNIAPTQKVPAVRAAGDSRELVTLRWGLIPFWAKDIKIGNRMINARSETVAEKPAFRASLKRKRCVILADGFYEWKKMSDGKQPFHIHLKDRKPFVFAGLWDRWDKGPIDPIESFTILTTSPNERVAELHNRMPVILTADALDQWLDPSINDAAQLLPLLQPYAAEAIEFSPVSKMVNRPANDQPQCMVPIEI
ncbi:MAG: SOS response-associated peptidase [Acidobacteriota bacterium]